MDSDRFGIRVAKASGEADGIGDMLAWCAEHSVDLLIARLSDKGSSDFPGMARYGFEHLETLIFWRLEVATAGTGETTGTCRTRIASPADAHIVERIARRAFQGYMGHYHRDPRLDDTECNEVYADWAARECRSSGARRVTLVAEIDGQAVGFTSLRVNGRNECEALLSAVLPAARRQGVFSILHHARLDWCRSEGLERLVASTVQANTAMRHCYEKAGFVPHGWFETFHKWFRCP